MGVFEGRYAESESTTGGGFINWSKLGVKKEDFFEIPKRGDMTFDIVPFIMGPENPRVVTGVAKEGDIDYMLDIWVHRNIGPANQAVICLRQSYMQRCPVCEYLEEVKTQFGRDSEQYKALRASRRVVYNLLDADAPAKFQNKIYVFSASHYLFQKELIEKAGHEGKKIGRSYIDFADPKSGKTITCRTSTESSAAGDMIKFKDFEFERREKGFYISDKMIERAFRFDSALNLFTADQIEAILFGQEGQQATENTSRKNRGSSRRPPDEAEAEEYEDSPRHSRGQASEDDSPRSRGRRSEPEEDSEEEAPARGRRSVEADDDPPIRGRGGAEEVEEETPRRGSKSQVEEEPEEQKCPADYKFGVDFEKYDECGECELWEDCAKAHKKLAKSRRSEE